MQLLKTRVPVVSREVCLREYRKQSGSHEFFQSFHLTTNMICAGFL